MNANELETVELARRTIPYGEGQRFDVRGLALQDVLAILNKHGRELLPALAMRIDPTNFDKPLMPGAEKEIVAMLVAAFPNILAMAIALANDSPDAEHIAVGLDVGTQFITLEAIIELSTNTVSMQQLQDALARIGAGVVGHIGVGGN